MTAPFLLALIAGGVEYGRGIALQIDLEQAAQRAAELAVARPPNVNTDTGTNGADVGWAHIEDEAEAAAGYPANSPNVTVVLYRDCSQTVSDPTDADGDGQLWETTTHKMTTYGSSCTTTYGAGFAPTDYVSVEIRGTYTRLINYRLILGHANAAVSQIKGLATVRVR